jgi:hypothetical protein
MKNSLRLLLGLVLLTSILLSACAPPPPPVSKDQLDTAENEAIAEEKAAADLNTELKALETDAATQEAELMSLKKYQKQLEAEK